MRRLGAALETTRFTRLNAPPLRNIEAAMSKAEPDQASRLQAREISLVVFVILGKILLIKMINE